MSSTRIRLKDIAIASPCDVAWQNMQGNDVVRHCNQCDKNVYNLIQMTEVEIDGLFATHEQGLPCIRLYRRQDGTVITQDHCAQYVPIKLKFPRTSLMPLMAGIVLAGCSFQPSLDHSKDFPVNDRLIPQSTYIPSPLGGVPMPPPMPENMIHEILQGHTQEFSQAFDQALKKHPQTPSLISIQLEINGTGKVTQATIPHTATVPPSLIKQILAIIKPLDFKSENWPVEGWKGKYTLALVATHQN